jgi:hypothetical protein
MGVEDLAARDVDAAALEKRLAQADREAGDLLGGLDVSTRAARRDALEKLVPEGARVAEPDGDVAPGADLLIDERPHVLRVRELRQPIVLRGDQQDALDVVDAELGARRTALDDPGRMESGFLLVDLELARLDASVDDLDVEVVFERGLDALLETERPLDGRARCARVVAGVDDPAHRVQVEGGDAPHLDPLLPAGVRARRFGPRERNEAARQHQSEREPLPEKAAASSLCDDASQLHRSPPRSHGASPPARLPGFDAPGNLPHMRVLRPSRRTRNIAAGDPC